jgi:hypothetical protein
VEDDAADAIHADDCSGDAIPSGYICCSAKQFINPF